MGTQGVKAECGAGVAIPYSSLAPLLVIIISISGLFFGHEAARGRVADQLKDLAGESAATAIQSLVQKCGSSGDKFVCHHCRSWSRFCSARPEYSGS